MVWDWKLAGACVYVLAGLALAALCLAGSVYRFCIDQPDRRKSDEGETVVQERKAIASQDREPGEWSPVAFDYPAIEPFNEDIMNVKPIPYRPFKWGEYHVTMGIRSMPWDEWIELDQHFYEYHKITDFRIRARPNRVIMYHPPQPEIVGSARPAAEELVQELAEFLVRRYPALYAVTRYEKGERSKEGWYSAGQIRTITIVPLKVTYDLETEDPLKVANLLVQEDWAIMMEGTDGQYWLQAGAVCKPGFWRLQDKLGMPLDEIHLSGNVPQFKSKLQLSMSRFFRRMPVGKPVTRNNYFFQVVKQPELQPQDDPAVHVDPTELSWARTMHGFEDKKDFERAALIREETEAETENVADRKSTEPLDPATVFLRTERQTLRRLPKTGAIVFTIRVYQTRVTDLVKEPGVPGRLASSIRGWSEDVAQYKDLFAYKDILQYLDTSHAEQLEKGLVGSQPRNPPYPF
ncbi:uncharacterized protein C8Q71DRAFT_719459 [Rhodofomes roseus]|uniref:Uncharacterized protein n=1 Tax=Rhodofomes roseus TaxID=34475 RepID=A0ABQ8KXF1_9APHY|nr:uncharacterized protein C8Q71DRAFT_719459 [Rhodofomes roseus]KAH9843744.1 hypothetical protein C8Q71DRAFT_719459 [Rhodofomes roseus]